MVRFGVGWWVMAAALAAAGCAAEPGVDRGQAATLALDFPPLFVCESGGNAALQGERYDLLRGDLGEAFADRSAAPGFRLLCDWVNRHCGEWHRLVVVERIGRVVPECGFLVVAVTDEGPKVVTNLQRSGDVWKEQPSTRVICVGDGRRIERCLAELDRAREVLPPRLFWFENIDWPVYVLHDLKAGDKDFSFAVCGPPQGEIDGLRVLPLPQDYAKAARDIGTETPGRTIDDGTPRGKAIREAGSVYAALVVAVWEASLGSHDVMIFGDFDAPKEAVSPADATAR